MKFRIPSAPVCAAALICSFQCYAFGQSEPPQPPPPASAASNGEAATASSETPQSIAVTVAKTNEVPQLTLRWDCGDCTQNEKVPPLIVDEYTKEAQAKGLVVSTTETAEVRIIEYRQRNPGARVMFGFLAGKDILKTKILFREKEYVAEDYSANAIFGINSLCAEVARQAIKQLSPTPSDK